MHHALFIETNTRNLSELSPMLKEIEISITSSDLVIEQDILKIEDARRIASAAQTATEDTRSIVVIFRSATREAQNALLKTTEEPASGIRLIFASPSFGSLLPTLQSRFTKVSVHSLEKTLVPDEVNTFLSSSLPERFKMIPELTESKEVASRFISNLTQVLLSERSAPLEALKSLEASSRFIQSPSASAKMILENLAIAIPRRS